MAFFDRFTVTFRYPQSPDPAATCRRVLQISFDPLSFYGFYGTLQVDIFSLSNSSLRRSLPMLQDSDGAARARLTSPLGRVVITSNALDNLPSHDVQRALLRHARGDWGELDQHDWQENQLSLQSGYRLLSAYTAGNGRKFWIITEVDRFVATRIETIDGTPQAPLVVMESVKDARQRFAGFLKEEMSSVDREWQTASASAFGSEEQSGEPEKVLQEFVTWLSDRQALLVHLVLRTTGGKYRTGGGTELKGPREVRENQGAIQYGVEVSLTVSAEYEFDRNGKLQRSEEMPVTTAVNRLDVPKGIRGP